MAAVKLTLRLEAGIIDQGKAYARRKGTSLSKMFEEYLKQQVIEDHEPISVIEVSQEVLELSVQGPKDFALMTDKELMQAYLDEKFDS